MTKQQKSSSNQKKSKLPSVLTISDFDTLEEYQEYLSIENSEVKITPISKERKKEWEQAAKNTLEKNNSNKKPIGLRLSEYDIRRIKSVASRRGLPYQSLIGSIIHQYLNGDLKEKYFA